MATIHGETSARAQRWLRPVTSRLRFALPDFSKPYLQLSGLYAAFLGGFDLITVCPALADERRDDRAFSDRDRWFLSECQLTNDTLPPVKVMTAARGGSVLELLEDTEEPLDRSA